MTFAEFIEEYDVAGVLDDSLPNATKSQMFIVVRLLEKAYEEGHKDGYLNGED